MGKWKPILAELFLDDSHSAYYTRSSLITSSRLFLLFRSTMSLYFLSWYVAQASIEELPKHFIYLTTWGESLLNIYFLSAFTLSVFLYYNPEKVFDRPNGLLRPVLIFSNFIRIVAFDLGICLSIAYWTLLRTEDSAFSWHAHLVNSVAIIIDIVVTDHPIVPLQFVWSIGVGLLYVLQSLLLFYFSTDEDYKILYEETLDWGNYPTKSFSVCFSVLFILMPAVHLGQYSLYKTKIRFLHDSSRFDSISARSQELKENAELTPALIDINL